MRPTPAIDVTETSALLAQVIEQGLDPLDYEDLSNRVDVLVRFRHLGAPGLDEPIDRLSAILTQLIDRDIDRFDDDDLDKLVSALIGFGHRGVPGLDELIDRLMEKQERHWIQAMRPDLREAAQRAIKAAKEARAARDDLLRFCDDDETRDDAKMMYNALGEAVVGFEWLVDTAA